MISSRQDNINIDKIFLDGQHTLEYLDITIKDYRNLDENFLKIKKIKLKVKGHFYVHIVEGEIVILDMTVRNHYIDYVLSQTVLLDFFSRIGMVNLLNRKINKFCCKNLENYSDVISLSNITSLLLENINLTYFNNLNCDKYPNITKINLLVSVLIKILDFSHNTKLKKISIKNITSSNIQCLINPNLEYLKLSGLLFVLANINSDFNLNTLCLEYCNINNYSYDITFPSQIKSLTFISDDYYESNYNIVLPVNLDYLHVSGIKKITGKLTYIKRWIFSNSCKLDCEKIDIIEIENLRPNPKITDFSKYIYHKRTWRK